MLNDLYRKGSISMPIPNLLYESMETEMQPMLSLKLCGILEKEIKDNIDKYECINIILFK